MNNRDVLTEAAEFISEVFSSANPVTPSEIENFKHYDEVRKRLYQMADRKNP